MLWFWSLLCHCLFPGLIGVIPVVHYLYLFTAIILPTLNLFLLSLDSTTLNDEENSKFNSPYLGIALSGFSLSAFFISPIFGYASDFTQSTKLTVLVGNCFKIGGKCNQKPKIKNTICSILLKIVLCLTYLLV